MAHLSNGSRKIIIIGIDGADWRLINPWIEDGCLKHFDEIVNEGTKGTLVSTIPPFTLPAWTSIFTGVNPGKHGITDNLLRINDSLVPASSKYRKQALVWRLLSDAGISSIVVNDPVTYPPEKINGIMVTGFLTPSNSENYIYPEELKGEVNKICGDYVAEIPLDYDKIIARDRSKAYELIKGFADKTARLALHLMKNHPWNVFNVTFTSTDRLQHFYWSDPNILKDHYGWIDSILRRFLNLASSENADTLIVSDHGFAPIHKSISVNTILAKKGFLHVKSNRFEYIQRSMGLYVEEVTDLFERLNMRPIVSRLVPRSLKRGLPSKYTRYAAEKPKAKLETNAGIFIDQLACNDYETVRSNIRKTLLTLGGDRRVFTAVYEREEVLWGPYVTRAPDIIVIPSEGYYVSRSLRDNIFEEPIQPVSRIRRTGDHSMRGIFAAYGPNIKKGRELSFDVQTWDIAPTALHILGLPIPDYMDGRVMKEIFKEGAPPRLRPVKLQKHLKPIPRQVAGEVHTLKEEEEIKKRLQSLGYL